MPAPFMQVSREQFAELVNAFEFRRKINAVHMHHTFRPDRSQYDKTDGHRTILAMFLYHTQVKKWQDIAQHITIAPDGTIWLGRNWNLPPASAAGHNGTKDVGPFMFETIGNFDRGYDRLDGEQRLTVIDVIARMQKRWQLPPESLKFHNSMSLKSCPGTSVEYGVILNEVRDRREQLAQAPETPEAPETPRAPFAPEHRVVDDAIRAALDSLDRDVPQATDPADAEPDYEDTERAVIPPETAHDLHRGPERGLTPDILRALRPHLVNLNYGQFSDDGNWKTDQGEVDAMFGEHLERALKSAEQRDEPLRILFFAHGGLVKESAGLEAAHKQVKWWIDNGIYPIYFVWETGFFETLRQLLSDAQKGARNFISDHVSDPILEEAVRVLRGPSIWNGMKLSAERASADKNSASGQGGAHYVAEMLQQFCARHQDKNIELHAGCHSAGAFFHSHFLCRANEMGVRSFKTVNFMAPAMRVDMFKKRLAGLMGPGKGIDQLSIFTMAKDYEREDNCAHIYRKSLLYLIYYALEPKVQTPILGLEQCLRADRELRSLFGLNAGAPAPGQVIFAVSPVEKGRSASTTTTHAGFDDDPPTMNSIVRRVLGKADADAIVEYSRARDAARDFELWQNQVDWPERRDGVGSVQDQAQMAAAAPFVMSAPHLAKPANGLRGRRALCIGINAYQGAPLSGCVADAEEWAKTFTQLGFETALIRDAEATRGAIVRSLNDLIAGAKPGEVIAIQFAGHGTRLPDLDGDEAEDDMDEAIVPYDYEDGAYLIDDDVRAILAAIPDGLNLTCFFDCCHSGTNTRFAIGTMHGRAAVARDQRKRFMVASPEMISAHQRFRGHVSGAGARGVPAGGKDMMKNVSFSACLAEQVAWESDGHGDFTVRAISVLQAGIGGMTNNQFSERVIAEFGPIARQRPLLDCASEAGAYAFLQPLPANGRRQTGASW